jgi:hypothetical protein
MGRRRGQVLLLSFAGAALGAGAGDASVLLVLLVPLSEDVAGAVPVAGALPPRKSVTYQPVPFN